MKKICKKCAKDSLKMIKSNIKPLFMWAGGKSRLLKHYLSYFPKNFDTYIEPFFGGGAVFAYLISKYPDKDYWINDINTGIINIYKSIKDNVSIFLNYIQTYQEEYLCLDYNNRKKMYLDLRTEHAFSYRDWEKTKEAATLYFLMKTGFNGIWQVNKNTNGRFGTPAGLLNQRENFVNIENILAWSKHLQKVKITNLSFQECIPKENSFIYLDPPYRGCFTQYGTGFNDLQQEEVIAYMQKYQSNNYILMSNRELGDGFFNNISNFNRIEIDVTYTAGRRKKEKEEFKAKKAKEILFYNTNNKKII